MLAGTTFVIVLAAQPIAQSATDLRLALYTATMSALLKVAVDLQKKFGTQE